MIRTSLLYGPAVGLKPNAFESASSTSTAIGRRTNHPAVGEARGGRP